MPNKKTLLLCWDFPPNDGIGGRRWAKMAKWLLKSGHEIHVIKSKSKVGNQNSVWLSDVKSDQIHIYEVNTYLALLNEGIIMETLSINCFYYIIN